MEPGPRRVLVRHQRKKAFLRLNYGEVEKKVTLFAHQILGWSILDHQSRNGFRIVRMYYPNGDMYREVGINEGVLDLCVRKDAKEDVNGNGYVENPNGFYKGNCEYKSLEMVQHYRYPPVFTRPESDPSPVIKQDEIVKDEVPSPGSNTSPTNGRPYLRDSAVGPRFVPLPTTISTITTRNGKPTRPFKAYPKEFLPLASSEGLLDDSNQRYMEFRRQFLSQLHASTALASNKNMKRPVQSDSPNQLPSSSGDAKDQAYWERRRKNNEAAKKSRDARRAKEDEIAIRAAFLERENIQLKLELASLRSETDRLRCMLYTS